MAIEIVDTNTKLQDIEKRFNFYPQLNVLTNSFLFFRLARTGTLPPKTVPLANRVGS